MRSLHKKNAAKAAEGGAVKYDIIIEGVEAADEDDAVRFAEYFTNALPAGTQWGRMDVRELSEGEGVAAEYAAKEREENEAAAQREVDDEVARVETREAHEAAVQP